MDNTILDFPVHVVLSAWVLRRTSKPAELRVVRVSDLISRVRELRDSFGGLQPNSIIERCAKKIMDDFIKSESDAFVKLYGYNIGTLFILRKGDEK